MHTGIALGAKRPGRNAFNYRDHTANLGRDVRRDLRIIRIGRKGIERLSTGDAHGICPQITSGLFNRVGV